MWVYRTSSYITLCVIGRVKQGNPGVSRFLLKRTTRFWNQIWRKSEKHSVNTGRRTVVGCIAWTGDQHWDGSEKYQNSLGRADLKISEEDDANIARLHIMVVTLRRITKACKEKNDISADIFTSMTKLCEQIYVSVVYYCTIKVSKPWKTGSTIIG